MRGNLTFFSQIKVVAEFVRKSYRGSGMQRALKEHGWVLISKSLTLPSAPPRAEEVI